MAFFYAHTQSGLFLLEHFFNFYGPDAIEMFPFNHDYYGNIWPQYMKRQAMRDHSVKFMDALVEGKKVKKPVKLHITVGKIIQIE